MSTITHAAPTADGTEPTTDADPRVHTERAPRPVRHARQSIYAQYVGAMLYFVGAGLISGAVVHYPIDPPVYTVIAIVGAFVFLLGTIVNEFVFAAVRPNVSRAISLVAFSLLLSFGVGLLGGGIQHFEQFPERSALMTPVGLLMSYVAFIAKDPTGRWRHLFSVFGAGVVVVAALSWVGMSALAETIGSAGHDHGTSTTDDGSVTGQGQDAPADAPADAPGNHTGEPEAPTGTQQGAAGDDDGHTSHDH